MCEEYLKDIHNLFLRLSTLLRLACDLGWFSEDLQKSSADMKARQVHRSFQHHHNLNWNWVWAGESTVVLLWCNETSCIKCKWCNNVFEHTRIEIRLASTSESSVSQWAFHLAIWTSVVFVESHFSFIVEQAVSFIWIDTACWVGGENI